MIWFDNTTSYKIQFNIHEKKKYGKRENHLSFLMLAQPEKVMTASQKTQNTKRTISCDVSREKGRFCAQWIPVFFVSPS